MSHYIEGDLMDIGRLNKRITFYKETDQGEIDEYGRNVMSLEAFKTIWASVEPLTGREYLEAQREANKQTYKIYTRYYKDLRDPNLVIGFKGRKFEIESVINYRENNEMLLFMCVEKVGETIG
jgi:SPP1 family predicted phage head-tail adaptor